MHRLQAATLHMYRKLLYSRLKILERRSLLMRKPPLDLIKRALARCRESVCRASAAARPASRGAGPPEPAPSMAPARVDADGTLTPRAQPTPHREPMRARTASNRVPPKALRRVRSTPTRGQC